MRTNIGTCRIAIAESLYWRYGGEPVLLLGGSADHNLFQWDLKAKREHLDRLAAAGGNYLRNTMSDREPGNVRPFAEISPGIYDLEQWNDEYWRRFTDLLDLTVERDIIVQLELFDRFDIIGSKRRGISHWADHPLRPGNNVNYTPEQSGLPDHSDFDQHGQIPVGIPGHPTYEEAPQERRAQFDLVRGHLDRFVDQILAVSLPYPNVLYCANNETHAHPSWGVYWIERIRAGARQAGVTALATDMFDKTYEAEASRRFAWQLQHPQHYDYHDISQVNSRWLEEVHWEKVTWLVDASRAAGRLTHMTKLYGNDDVNGGDPFGSCVFGDDNNAIEEWWQNLIAGVAGERFHRPTHGLGLSDKAVHCIKATRKIESLVKFWDVEARQDLLLTRQRNAAYLAADPGERYILYFTAEGAGTVDLDLRGAVSRFEVRWVSVDSGEWGETTSLTGGEMATMRRPGAGHWVAAITRA